ncbi:MAG: methyltransferase domain-containing protein [Anaerolineales bacterium]|nr:methyltransferase domain-containing protein [Anaerolineales bacterium]
MVKPRFSRWRWLDRLIPRLYAEFAWIYNLAATLVSRGRWLRWQLAAIDDLPPGRLLEIGSGPGYLLTRLPAKGYSVIGVDRSSQMVRMTSRRLRRLQVSAGIIQADVKKLPFPAGSADGVVSCFPTEYILAPETASELHRILAPGGMVVVIPFAVPDRTSWSGRIAGFLLNATSYEDEIPLLWKENFQAAGFEVDWKLVDVSGDVVYRMRLIKILTR